MREVFILVSGLFLGDVLYFFRWGRRIEAAFSRFAGRQALAALTCAAVSMLPRLLLLRWLPSPEPLIPDEFSYVLGAQTFALGRITNPMHPFWQHFESLHINAVPTYQSMYTPAPSLFMAGGILFGGNPWWGVWLACGLMCASFCWALQPLIRPKYAFAAGLFAALKYGMFTQYGDSYWGGAVPALGAALALGAFVRLKRTQQLSYVALFVLGIGILANSRPYEGALFSAPLGIAFLIWVVRKKTYVRILAPAMAMFAFVATLSGYYNYRSTGHATLMPYMVNYRQYHFVRPFIGTGLDPVPHYRHYQIAKLLIDWEGRPGKLAQTRKGVEYLTINKYRYYYGEHFAPLMIVALVGLAYTLRSRHRLELSATFLLVCLGLFAVVWWPLSSYPAPLLVSFFGLAFLGIRYLRTFSLRRYQVGFYWARGLAVVLLLSSVLQYHDNFQLGKRLLWGYPASWNIERQRVIHQLENSGGEHLVIVRYSRALHVHYQEWIYNSPDIDHQKVILARSMGTPSDCELMNYYRNRKIWFLYPDGAPWPQLVPVNTFATCNDNRPIGPTPYLLTALR